VRLPGPTLPLFWTTSDLEAKLLDFKHYYNEHRTHAGRRGHPPVTGVSTDHSPANLKLLSMAEALSRLIPNADGRLILVIRHRQVSVARYQPPLAFLLPLGLAQPFAIRQLVNALRLISPPLPDRLSDDWVWRPLNQHLPIIPRQRRCQPRRRANNR